MTSERSLKTLQSWPTECSDLLGVFLFILYFVMSSFFCHLASTFHDAHGSSKPSHLFPHFVLSLALSATKEASFDIKEWMIVLVSAWCSIIKIWSNQIKHLNKLTVLLNILIKESWNSGNRYKMFNENIWWSYSMKILDKNWIKSQGYAGRQK